MKNKNSSIKVKTIELTIEMSAGLRAFFANMAIMALANRGFADAPINETDIGVASWPLLF